MCTGKRLTALVLAFMLLLSCCNFVSADSCRRRIPDNEGIRFVQKLGPGINLGNTFDAHSEGLEDEMEYETVWCQVETTRELIEAIRDAGFKSIRIPVSWHDHVSDDGNYTISEAWLNRVNEVVDWCIDAGLYVILNIHHDDAKDLLYPSYQKSAQSVKYITAIWSQLAERFRDYGEQLLFESMNEPRLTGTLYEWLLMPVSPSCIEAVRQIDAMNRAFVNTVRASGGNNETRYLLCPGYDASPDGALNLGYSLPKDPIANDHHIIVAVHAYKPNSFAQQANGLSRWSSRNLLDTAPLTSFMDGLYLRYVSKGVPVLIDEFGSVAKSGNLSSRVDHAAFFVRTAAERGMSCLWWDNNICSGEGERFGLIDRASLQWAFPEIVKAMVNNS